MNKQEMLSKAIQIAANAHQGQYDKGGSTYILHPLKVMHYLKSDDSELQCIAVLHDVIEDTSYAYQDLRDYGMSERVIEGVRCMTKQCGETFEEYKLKVMSNTDSAKVKMCDLRHNSDIRRLKDVTAKDIARIEKYHKFYLEIKEMIGGN